MGQCDKTDFFTEQLGLMSLAIFYYDGDIALTPVPRESTSVIKAVSKPTRSIENLNIPKSVYAHLLVKIAPYLYYEFIFERVIEKDLLIRCL